jgi:mercuric ion binding protein
MKTRMMSTIAMLLVGVLSLMANEGEKAKIKVAGNCNMCKARIEKAALSVEGVSAAAWDKETKMLEIEYDAGKSDLKTVQMAIAEAGHDTESCSATDEAYEALPACCKFERLEAGAIEGRMEDQMNHMDHTEHDQ